MAIKQPQIKVKRAIDKTKVIQTIGISVVGLLTLAYAVLRVWFPTELDAIMSEAQNAWALYSVYILGILGTASPIASIKLGQITFDAKAVKAIVATDKAKINAQSKQINLILDLLVGVLSVVKGINAKDINKVRREATEGKLALLENSAELVKKYDISKLDDSAIKEAIDSIDATYQSVKDALSKQ